MNKPDLQETPLRPAVDHILLALAARPLHRLGIAESVERDTDGVMELGPGTRWPLLQHHRGDPDAGGIDQTAETTPTGSEGVAAAAAPLSAVATPYDWL